VPEENCYPQASFFRAFRTGKTTTNHNNQTVNHFQDETRQFFFENTMKKTTKYNKWSKPIHAAKSPLLWRGLGEAAFKMKNLPLHP
jgi:hypothetical protein